MFGVHSGVTTLVDQGGPSCMTFPALPRVSSSSPADAAWWPSSPPTWSAAWKATTTPSSTGPDCIAVDATVSAGPRERRPGPRREGHAEIGGFARWGDEVMRRAAEIGAPADLPLYIHFGQLWPLPERRATRVDADTILPSMLKILRAGRHPGASLHPPSRRLRRPRRQGASDGARSAGARPQDRRRPRLAFLLQDGAPGARGRHRARHAGRRHARLQHDRAAKPRGTPEAHPDKEEMHMFAGAAELLAGLGHDQPCWRSACSLEQVVPMVTSNCAAMLGMTDEIGTLKPGVEADVSVLDDESGRLVLKDNEEHAVLAERFLAPVFCLRAGKRYDADAAILPAADPGRRRMTAEPWRGSASAHRFAARKTRASCTGAAASSATSARRACWRWRSCAPRRACAACAASPNRPAPRSACSPPRTCRRGRRSAPTPPCRASRLRSAGAGAGKVRHVGEADRRLRRRTRAEAEDLAAACELDYEELPAVHDMLAARAARRAADARGMGRQRSSSRRGGTTTVEASTPIAAAKVTRTLRTARQCMAPLEGRGVLREWDPRLETARSSPPRRRCRTSPRPAWPNASASTRARCASSRPTSAAASATRASCCPRRSSAPARAAARPAGALAGGPSRAAHRPTPTAASTTTTSPRGPTAPAGCSAIDCEATVDSGAYSSYPFGACLEAAQVGSILPGPYKLPR